MSRADENTTTAAPHADRVTLAAHAKPAAIRGGNVLAFTPTPAAHKRIAARLPDTIERLPSAALLEYAETAMALTVARPSEPSGAIVGLHAAFGAMLALCRFLDEAAYPWDAGRVGAGACAGDVA